MQNNRWFVAIGLLPAYGAYNGLQSGNIWAGAIAGALVAACLYFIFRCFGHIRRFIATRLDTTVKRKWFLLFPLGCIFVLLAILMFPLPTEILLSSPAVFLPSQFEGIGVRPLISIFWLGMVMALLGVTFSFGYDFTVLKVRRWVNGEQ